MEKKPVLEVRGLSISFSRYLTGFAKRELSVIHDLNITIHASEVVAVVGSSGSGKSLLAHEILGILPYNATVSGEIAYKGDPLTAARKKELRGREIVLVPQGVDYLDPLLRVGPQLLAGQAGEAAGRKLRETLGRYGLSSEVERLYPFELSGGMARRVLVATAAMAAPSLVVADEPTPGLHLEAAKVVLGHFREMADGGAGVLLITHDLELALEVADRVVVFYAGMSLEEASGSDFDDEANLRHPYTRALWAAMPKNGFKVADGLQPYAGDMPTGCPYGPRCGKRGDECAGNIPYEPFRGGFVRCARASEVQL
jgi:peptide/nickel transport system ATP-binding protein